MLNMGTQAILYKNNRIESDIAPAVNSRYDSWNMLALMYWLGSRLIYSFMMIFWIPTVTTSPCARPGYLERKVFDTLMNIMQRQGEVVTNAENR